VRFWFLVATLLAVLSPALPSGLRLLAGASFPSVHGLLERLRAEAEVEAARPITPQQQRSISYAHKYWVEIAFGVRQKQSNRTAAQQMGLAATPAPATIVILAPAVEAPALVPHTWWAAAASLTTAELNRTLVALQPEKRLFLAADVFFVQGCVRLVSVQECGGWTLDFSRISVAVHGAWEARACSPGAQGLLSCPLEASIRRSDGPLPPSRVQTRLEGERFVHWELCSGLLAGMDVVDVEFAGWGVSRRWQLSRVDDARRPSEELAMVVLMKSASALLPTWLQTWRALGVGRFYLYVNGKLDSLAEEDASMAARLAADPGVTLIEWDLPYAQADGIYVSNDTIRLHQCAGHYSQVAAFAHAFERIKRRHLYLGFHDPDEFGALHPSLLRAAWAKGVSPMLQLLGLYAFPNALKLANRWGAIVPSSHGGDAPISPSAAVQRAWFGASLVGSARGKSWVRTVDTRDDVGVSVHDLLVFYDIKQDARTGTMLASGTGWETRHLNVAVVALAEHASQLHISNGKAHVSSSQAGFKEELGAAIADMIQNDRRAGGVELMLERAFEDCVVCREGAPGCGYPC